MKHIHIIPTDKPSRFYNNNKGEYHFREHYVPDVIETCKNHHMYITSDEEIKDCWVFNTHTNQVYFLQGFYGQQPIAKKITLTTDQDLIKYGVEAITQKTWLYVVKKLNSEGIFDKIVKE